MGWVVSATPRPRGKIRYPLYRRLGWGEGGAPGPVWTGAENLACTGILYPDRLARSKSLYRLSYPGSKFLGSSPKEFFLVHLEEIMTFIWEPESTSILILEWEPTVRWQFISTLFPSSNCPIREEIINNKLCKVQIYKLFFAGAENVTHNTHFKIFPFLEANYSNGASKNICCM